MNTEPASARPAAILREVMAMVPRLSQCVNTMYARRANEKISEVEWPQWCFLPRRQWAEIIRDEMGNDYLGTSDKWPMCTRIAVAGTWRYGQGVYEFDPDVLAAIAESAVPKNIPPSVLLRLPEWCIYVPTPTMTFLGENMLGFFATLDRCDINDATRYDAMQLMIDIDGRTVAYHIYLSGGSIVDSMKIMYNDYVKHVPHATKEITPNDLDDVVRDLTPIVSIVLYICGDEPDISGKNEPIYIPRKSEPKRIKGAQRMFPASAPKVWQVGQTIGETIRKAKSGADGGGGRGRKRPHLRRGHFHGAWSGKMDGSEERKYKLNWWPPIMVAADLAEHENDIKQ
jgi:hypothetical protein